jgi:hypothetical protein
VEALDKEFFGKKICTISLSRTRRRPLAKTSSKGMTLSLLLFFVGFVECPVKGP